MNDLFIVKYAQNILDIESGDTYVLIKGYAILWEFNEYLYAKMRVSRCMSDEYDTLKSVADRYQEAITMNEGNEPPGDLLLEAPGGFSCDWDQNRGFYFQKNGELAGGAWEIHLQPGEKSSIHIARSKVSREYETGMRDIDAEMRKNIPFDKFDGYEREYDENAYYYGEEPRRSNCPGGPCEECARYHSGTCEMM